MSELADLATALRLKPRTSQKLTAADLPANRPHGSVTTELSFKRPEESMPYNPESQPGDPDFDWSRYADYKAGRNAVEAPAMAMGHHFAAEDKAAEEAGNRSMQAEKFASGEIPTSFGSGAYQHFIEKEDAARNALLGIPALAMGPVGAAAVIGAAPFVGRGLEQASKTSHSDYTVDEGALPSDVSESLMGLLGGKAITKGAQTVRGVRQFVNKSVPAWLRMPLAFKAAAADVAMSEPALSAAERVGKILTPGGFRDAAANVGRGLVPGPQEAGSALSEVLSPAEALAEASRRAKLRTNWQMGSEVPMGGGVQEATDPYQVLNTAKAISMETGEPISKTLKGGSKAYTTQQRDAIEGLRQAGNRARDMRASR